MRLNLTRRELSDDIIVCTDATPAEVVELLGNFRPGEYWEKSFFLLKNQNPQDTSRMERYMERLKEHGLDIGKGNCQYGYKMPPPQKGQSTRVLQIFRRK